MIDGENPYSVTGKSPADAQSALAEAERWMRPASLEALTRALSDLYMLTARRAEDSTDRKAVVLLYARKLSEYPGDIALEHIARYRGSFFPALDELRLPIECDARIRERGMRIAALRDFLENPPKEMSITPEDRAAMSAKAARLKQELAG